jgi:citronellol/citronellal dehydrogenase
MSLKGKIIFITGSSRGVGRALAIRFACEGAKVVIAAKSATENPKLPGTIYSVADEVRQAGGEALAIPLDVREEESIQSAFRQVADEWGGVDVLINNASAIFPAAIIDTPMKRFDLLMAVNVRGTFACSQAAIPYLEKSVNPHIINIAPPLNMKPRWFSKKLAYTISKYGMSMCTLGLAEELKEKNIAVNSLWPQTTLATMAVKVFFGEKMFLQSRQPEIMADAAYFIITANAQELTGKFLIDEAVLREKGVTDFSHYLSDQNAKPPKDFYLD